MSDLSSEMSKFMKTVHPHPLTSLEGTVMSINEILGVASVKLSTKIVLKKVNLSASGTDVLLIPALNSKVVVNFVDNDHEKAYIIKYSNVDKIIAKAGKATTHKLTLSDEGVIVENQLGSLNLLEYCGQINKILQFINTWGKTCTPPLTLPPNLQPPIFP